MPLDGRTYPAASPPREIYAPTHEVCAPTREIPASTREVYAERRRAAVALWQGVPARNFSLRFWVTRRDPATDPHDCRTIACAIGWLAVCEHDGWSLDGGNPQHRDGALDENPFRFPLVSAMCYFNLPYDTAYAIFGSRGDIYPAGPNATLPDVSAALLAAPYARSLP